MKFRSRRRRNRLPLVVVVAGVVLGVVMFFQSVPALGRPGAVPVTPTPEPPQLAPTNLATAVPTATAVPAPALAPAPVQTPTPVIHANDARLLPRLLGFVAPIRRARLPDFAGQLPNAPRPYRNGVHEGIDFYSITAGVPIKIGTEVLAARAGRVVRADVDYREWSDLEMKLMLNRAFKAPSTPPDVLDALRGRQVWIYHGDDVYTRYVHLSGIAPGIQSGVSVEAGQVIAYVGNSGSPEAAEGTSDDVHLHFEIWIGDEYFGKGLDLKQMLAWLAQMFAR